MRPTWVEIDLGAIRRNVAAIRAVVGDCALCAVVKADAYGHGDVPVAEAVLDAGADQVAVALVEEGVRLREAGIRAPILLLSEPAIDDVEAVVRWRLTPTVYTHRILDRLTSGSHRGPIPVHVKVDTGMHRVGTSAEDAAVLAKRIHQDPGLTLGGVWTHFAVADEDPDFTDTQVARFASFLAILDAAGIDPGVRHAANTAGALAFPSSRYDMVRVGLGLYGMRPAPHVGSDVELHPAMRVVSQVAHVRSHPAGTRPSYGRRRPLPTDAGVATIPIGYADGVARRLSSVGGEVLIRGRRHEFAGAVTMDQILVDVGESGAVVGDEVVLLGSQGGDAVLAEEWAERLGTINYEIVCRFGPRVPRRYFGAGE